MILVQPFFAADLYSDSVRDAFRSDFKKYVEARIAYYKSYGHGFLVADQKRCILSGGSVMGKGNATIERAKHAHTFQ
jgi:hypothetical protein